MIYLDHNASTPVLPEVLEKVLPFFTRFYANPSSKTHVAGKMAEESINKAREQVASYLGCHPSEIKFTSGSTESINIAIRGAFAMYGKLRNHVIVSATEHSAVLDTVGSLRALGAEVTVIPVGPDGNVNPETLLSEIRPDTLMACVMAANNETGNINPLKEIGDLLLEKSVLFFCDASQAPFKMNFLPQIINASLLCISGHKMNGLKGAGALYIRRKNPRVKLQPVLFGGGQEEGIRPGTLNTPAIVSLGEVCELAETSGEEKMNYLLSLRRPLLDVLCKSDKIILHTDPDNSLSNTLNFSIKGLVAGEIIAAFSDLCLATGSACTSASPRPSHVLTAMDVDDDLIKGAIRVSFGLTNTPEEAQVVADLFRDFLNKL